MAYPNPFVNPFKKANIKDAAMEEDHDEDDDLKMAQDEDDDLKTTQDNQKKEPLTTRQRQFAKFKKLQQTLDRKQAEKEQWSIKRSRRQRKKLRAERGQKFGIKKRSKKRANSLPRNKDDVVIQDDDAKNDYIWFHERYQDKVKLNEKKPDQFDALDLETSTLNNLDKSSQSQFDALSKKSESEAMKSNNSFNIGPSVEIHTACYRSIRVPGHRMVHVHRMWKDICNPIVKHLKLQIRMNSRKKVIELRMVNNALTEDMDSIIGKGKGKGKQTIIQKGSDFIRAVVIGFEIRDALALIRMDDVFLESFDIRDVKYFYKKSDHWMRAIGRIAGQYGKIKYSIENSTNTRIIVFGFKVHILGSFASIGLARNSISRLVIGSAPGNVYSKLRVVSNRLKHKF